MKGRIWKENGDDRHYLRYRVNVRNAPLSGSASPHFRTCSARSKFSIMSDCQSYLWPLLRSMIRFKLISPDLLSKEAEGQVCSLQCNKFTTSRACLVYPMLRLSVESQVWRPFGKSMLKREHVLNWHQQEVCFVKHQSLTTCENSGRSRDSVDVFVVLNSQN